MLVETGRERSLLADNAPGSVGALGQFRRQRHHLLRQRLLQTRTLLVIRKHPLLSENTFFPAENIPCYLITPRVHQNHPVRSTENTLVSSERAPCCSRMSTRQLRMPLVRKSCYPRTSRAHRQRRHDCQEYSLFIRELSLALENAPMSSESTPCCPRMHFVSRERFLFANHVSCAPKTHYQVG